MGARGTPGAVPATVGVTADRRPVAPVEQQRAEVGVPAERPAEPAGRRVKVARVPAAHQVRRAKGAEARGEPRVRPVEPPDRAWGAAQAREPGGPRVAVVPKTQAPPTHRRAEALDPQGAVVPPEPAGPAADRRTRASTPRTPPKVRGGPVARAA